MTEDRNTIEPNDANPSGRTSVRGNAKRKIAILALLLLAVLAHAFSRPRAPKSFETVERLPVIYPDYVQTTFPINLAPANFLIKENCDDAIVEIQSANGRKATVRGSKVQIPPRTWRKLLDDSRDAELVYSVYVKQDGKWLQFQRFANHVSSDPIDQYVVYRLIEPGYEFGHRICLAERNLQTYNERVYMDNRLSSPSPCVNCHTFQDHGTERFLFHYRRIDDPTQGGTIVVDGSHAKKVSCKLDAQGVSCSYPAWRPNSSQVVFSTNVTRQLFHALSTQKIDVFDAKSDLAFYDVQTNELRAITTSEEEHETFPTWSPDGKTLYYSSATLAASHADSPDHEELIKEMTKRVEEFHYDIKRMSFDPQTRQFGEPETVVNASATQNTALFPRISPDGRFLVYTRAKSGTFPIWRPEADLYIKDLETGEERAWDQVNSDDTESYHSWSSTGRWIVLSSRREDGQFTRLYFAHVDDQGRADKPFVLPQYDPEHNRKRYKSYNVPEFIVEPIKTPLRNLRKAALSEPEATKNL
ncbi:MAG: hypothetical protein Q4G03_02940 [Planctomycetia bacterium]|nr:hypothetical protein [Planctomycetia bacterium]